MVTTHDPSGPPPDAIDAPDSAPDAVTAAPSLKTVKELPPTGDLAVTQVSLELRPGSILGRLYRVVRHLGSGSQGDVYEVEHVRLGTRFAAKLLRPSINVEPKLIARLEREAISTSKIEHPNIARVVNLDQTEDGQTFVIMDLLRGENLEDVLKAGPLSIRDACTIALDVASALETAHGMGIVHRDLKPANVFLAETSLGRIAKVTDFGLSKVIEASDLPKLTKTGTVLGTPIYMSPEQVTEGHTLDQRSDIYSLGVVLFEMLTGQPPFSSMNVVELLLQHVEEPPPDPRSLRKDIPEGLSQIILRTLSKNPDQRPSTMTELAESIRQATNAIAESDPGGRRITAGRSSGDPPSSGTPAAAADPPPSAPQPRAWVQRSDTNLGRVLVGRYRIEKLIASGGMGRVYLATQMPLERPVAIKLLSQEMGIQPDPEFIQRFCVEASILARLAHPNIVTVHDYGEADHAGDLFMAMEYLDGEPLSDVIKAEVVLPPERVIDIGLQICRGLYTAHSEGVIHRDLKPGNIMLLRRRDVDSPAYVKVLDFGLVKLFETRPEPGPKTSGSNPLQITRAGKILGSPRYMAPEQIDGQPVDPRTDIYALGIILYEMTAGRPPFDAKTEFAMFHQHLFQPPPPIEACPPELEAIISRCLEKSPDKRYPSMLELMQDLKSAGRLITGISMSSDPRVAAFDTFASDYPPSRASAEGGARPGSLASGSAGAAHGRSPSGARSVAQASLQKPERRVTRVVGAALAVLVAVAGGVIALAGSSWLSPSPSTRSTADAPATAPVAPQRPVVQAHELTIESTPPAAAVTEEGRSLGVTPLRVALDSSPPRSRDFALSLPGYATRMVHQEPVNQDVRIVVSLLPLDAPPKPGREAPPKHGRRVTTPKPVSPAKTGPEPDIRLNR